MNPPPMKTITFEDKPDSPIDGSWIKYSDLVVYLEWCAEKFSDDRATLERLIGTLNSGMVHRLSNSVIEITQTGLVYKQESE